MLFPFLDTVRKGRLLNVLCTFNLRPVSTGCFDYIKAKILKANILSNFLVIFSENWIFLRSQISPKS